MAKDAKKSKKDKGAKKDKAPKKASGAFKQEAKGNEPSIVRKLDGSLALTKLKHAVIEKKNKKGKKVKMLVIPVKDNFLFEGDNGALYLNVRVNLKDGEDQYKQHGFVSQQVPSDIWKAASDEEQEAMKKTPILGGLKDWEFEAGASNDTAGADNSIGGDIDPDDLPF